MARAAILIVCLLGMTATASGFDLSSSYSASPTLMAGYYACRSGLDFDDFTTEFDVSGSGAYALRGQAGKGQIVMSPDGAIAFDGGPLMSDAVATTYAVNATRLSDGNAVIIIRYDFGTVVTDDYCALVE